MPRAAPCAAMASNKKPTGRWSCRQHRIMRSADSAPAVSRRQCAGCSPVPHPPVAPDETDSADLPPPNVNARRLSWESSHPHLYRDLHATSPAPHLQAALTQVKQESGNGKGATTCSSAPQEGQPLGARYLFNRWIAACECPRRRPRPRCRRRRRRHRSCCSEAAWRPGWTTLRRSRHRARRRAPYRPTSS